MIEIRDSKGEIFNKVENPAVVADKNARGKYMWIKIGEKKDMQDYYDQVISSYTAVGAKKLAEDFCLVDLPNDQEIIDKIFQTTGYLDKFIKENIEEVE